MFHLYQSNRLETLFELLNTVVKNAPLASAFTEEVVVVQSQGMGRWITLHLADSIGICANMRFQLPATFIWQLFRNINPELPKRSAFTPDVLAWRIAAVLADEEFLAQHVALAGYVQGQMAVRRFELASKIADTFDQYLMYRPDWLESWEAGQSLGLGQDEAWQQPLWQRLASASDAPHRSRMLTQLFDALSAGKRPSHLPDRVVFFGISNMPPVYVEILHRLSAHMDILLFVLNPCEHPWGHVTSKTVTGPAGPDEWYVAVDQPLLASLGRQGRDFMDLLIEQHSAQIVDLFQPVDNQSLLAKIQQDVLALQPPMQDFTVHTEDDSVQLHVCHSPMRELEVLHDQLLRLFDQHPDLQAADVAVLMPDINTYAPLIDAVFSRREGVPSIPYGIADRALQTEQPLVSAFADLLSVLPSRFEATRVLALLECDAIASRFGLNKDDLPSVREWVQAAGIRWGKDAAHKKNLGLPEDDLHTWRYGLDRMVLGVALPPRLTKQLPLWQTILPCEVAVGSQSSVLTGLLQFIDQLFHWSLKVNTDQAGATEWVLWLNQLLEDFFLVEDETTLTPLRECFARLGEDTKLASYGDAIPFAWMSEWLAQGWKQAYGSTGFLSGGVTFCAMVPMRSLPFKVICLLGLNDGDFPRHLQPHSFDLMHRHYRRGDRYRRFDDRYLFLEALISARQFLYLSYVGVSIRDGSTLPPSPLLAELIEVVEGTCVDPNSWRDHQYCIHPLQAFDQRYFVANDRLQSYSQPLAQASRLAGMGEQKNTAWVSAGLPAENLPAHELANWLQCFRQPARYFLTQRLGIRLPAAEELLSNTEPFELDWHGRQTTREDLLLAQAVIAGDFTPAAFALTKAQGVLPPGMIGEQTFQTEQAEIQPLLSALQRLPAALPERLPFELILPTGQLNGVLGGLMGIRLTRDGLVGGNPDKIRPFDYFSLWLQHLVLCAIQPKHVALQSQWLGWNKDKKTELISFKTVEAPIEYLAIYAQAFERAWCEPLPFFIKSSDAWMRSFRDKGDEEAAMKAARSIWEAPAFRYEEYHRGESEHPYYQAVYRGSDPLNTAFTELTETLLLPMFEHMQSTILTGEDA